MTWDLFLSTMRSKRSKLQQAISSWVLLDGVVTLILGLMIYVQWPSTAAWAIGVLVSASLVTRGLTRAMLSVAVRKSITPGPERTKQDDSSAKDYWSVHE